MFSLQFSKLKFFCHSILSFNCSLIFSIPAFLSLKGDDIFSFRNLKSLPKIYTIIPLVKVYYFQYISLEYAEYAPNQWRKGADRLGQIFLGGWMGEAFFKEIRDDFVSGEVRLTKIISNCLEFLLLSKGALTKL